MKLQYQQCMKCRFPYFETDSNKYEILDRDGVCGVCRYTSFEDILMQSINKEESKLEELLLYLPNYDQAKSNHLFTALMVATETLEDYSNDFSKKDTLGLDDYYSAVVSIQTDIETFGRKYAKEVLVKNGLMKSKDSKKPLMVLKKIVQAAPDAKVKEIIQKIERTFCLGTKGYSSQLKDVYTKPAMQYHGAAPWDILDPEQTLNEFNTATQQIKESLDLKAS